jgi:hypothetical protein
MKLEDEIRKASSTQITEEDRKIYENSRHELENLQKQKNNNEKDHDVLKKLLIKSFIQENIDYELFSVSQDGRKSEISNFYSQLKIRFIEEWKAYISQILTKISDQKLEIEKKEKEISENVSYKKVLIALSESSQVKEFEDRLKIEKEKLAQVQELVKNIEELENQKQDLIEKIKKEYKKFETESDAIAKELSDTVDGLEIKAEASKKEDRYKEILENSLHNNRIENKKSLEDDSSNIFDVFNGLIDGRLLLKNGYTSEGVAKSLLTENLYKIHYELIYEGDTFRKMSYGKKAFVVLKLLLDFSEKDCPILIDQPEDDLDNRSIYNELVSYIKKKKRNRQIIIATHNSNVVVTADSEQVIVANQNGIGTLNRDGKKFQYISGSLENTSLFNEKAKSVLESQGIQEHVCDILEGGKAAFEQRKKKYNI